MKTSNLFVTWLGTALWTVAGTSFALATDSIFPPWPAVWVTDQEGFSDLWDGIQAVSFVVVNTALFLLLMLMLMLMLGTSTSDGFRP
jgi:hypothetical protein